MLIKTYSFHPYDQQLTTGTRRQGVYLKLCSAANEIGWGEIAPLPGWSQETLEEAIQNFERHKDALLSHHWNFQQLFSDLSSFDLLPSTLFGFESALLMLLNPIVHCKVATSALFMGTKQQILKQAETAKGYSYAKLKVSQLTFQEAKEVIHQLKNTFRLRIDVNRAWTTKNSLNFFEQFPSDTFDYVEEPFDDPKDLNKFNHPLAIDESFPADLSLDALANLPKLKALIYKPTLQGGMTKGIILAEWAKKRGIDFVLSSSFENVIGLKSIAMIAQRLSLSAPIGIGTHAYLSVRDNKDLLNFENSFLHV